MVPIERARPTLRQVAAEAGVSVATVSNAVNGTGRLSEETRRRVFDAVDRLNYLPYATLRSARRGGTGVLGLTMTSLGQRADYTAIPYYSELILGTTAAAHSRGYLLVILPATLPTWSLNATPLDGVVQSEPLFDDPVGAALRRRGVPLVMAGRPPVPERTDVWVDTDDAAATRDLLDHLRTMGSRRIGLVLPRHPEAFPTVVSAAYDAWCDEAGQERVVEEFDLGEDYEDAERSAVRRLLARGPDAAFGLYSSSGHHLLAGAREAGLAVPRDLRVACFGDDPSYLRTDPQVTTIGLNPREIGAAAVDQLLAVIGGRRGFRRQRLLPATMTIRRSTAG